MDESAPWASSLPPADVEVDADLVAALVAEQHPDVAGVVVPVAQGWDNAVFRLGADLAVRMPRRRLGADLVASERRWVPRLAPLLPLEVPVPVRAGRPGLGYPYEWTIVRWVEGTTLLEAERGAEVGPADVGAVLGRFCAALHRPAPPDAPHNPWRGVPLHDRDRLVTARFRHLPDDVDRDALLVTWVEARDAPVWDGPALWVHGDLHPGNVVARQGRVVGVIDFGDLTAGDPAADLGVAWMLPGGAGRARFRAAVEASGAVADATWRRAQGNALAHAVAVLAGEGANGSLGRVSLRAVHDLAAEGRAGPGSGPDGPLSRSDI